MKFVYPLVNFCASDFIFQYLVRGSITDLGAFGIKAPVPHQLTIAGFHRTGLDDFFLMEKSFRLVGTSIEINLKLYFSEGRYISNGLDISGYSLSRALDDILKLPIKLDEVELLYDGDASVGSLFLNQHIELLFQKAQSQNHRARFMLNGIATAAQIDSVETTRSNLAYSRMLKPAISLARFGKSGKRSHEIAKKIEQLLSSA